MASTSQELRQKQQHRIKETGSPHGIMPAEELVQVTTAKWEQIRNGVPIEDRQEFEPFLEALLGRVASSTQASYTSS